MRIVKNKRNTDFQVKIGNQYVTVASLVPWLISPHMSHYELYFYYYGEEFQQGTYACQHRNGNESIHVWQEEYELWNEFLYRIKKLISKKLYVIGSSVLNEIKYVDLENSDGLFFWKNKKGGINEKIHMS